MSCWAYNLSNRLGVQTRDQPTTFLSTSWVKGWKEGRKFSENSCATSAKLTYLPEPQCPLHIAANHYSIPSGRHIPWRTLVHNKYMLHLLIVITFLRSARKGWILVFLYVLHLFKSLHLCVHVFQFQGGFRISGEGCAAHISLSCYPDGHPGKSAGDGGCVQGQTAQVSSKRQPPWQTWLEFALSLETWM